jgi:hypothetical protein
LLVYEALAVYLELGFHLFDGFQTYRIHTKKMLSKSAAFAFLGLIRIFTYKGIVHAGALREFWWGAQA